MRKVVASIFVTVDGVMEDPGGAEGFDLGVGERKLLLERASEG